MNRRHPGRPTGSHTHTVRLATLAACALVVAAACGDDDDGGDGTADGTAAGSTAAAASGTAAAESSDNPCGADPALVAAAEEEGEVVLFGGGHTREGADNVVERFEDIYDVSVTVNRQPTGDIVQQVEASIEADSVQADVVSVSDVTAFVRWAEEEIIVDAEVPNLDDLIDGVVDPSRPSFPYALTPLGIVYNSSRIDPAEAPTTWTEFAEQLDGHVLAHADPSSSGTALGFMMMASDAAGEDYYDGFADDDLLVVESALALNQMVLTGEADFGAPAIESEVELAKSNGEPLEMIYPADGVPVFSAEIAVLADAPHPNAARLLAQFHVCKAFQDELGALGGHPVLTGSPAPQGVPDLADFEVVSLSAAALESRRDALLEQFASVAG